MSGKGRVRVGDAITVPNASHGLPCCPHTLSGAFFEGSGGVVNNKDGVVGGGIGVGDRATTDCPHCPEPIAWADTGSGSCVDNEKVIHRQGDQVLSNCTVSNVGTSTEGSGDVLVGD